MSDKQYDTLIIGAGAAGLMAGIQAAGRGKQVLILEKMERPGRKLLITGKVGATSPTVVPWKILCSTF